MVLLLVALLFASGSAARAQGLEPPYPPQPATSGQASTITLVGEFVIVWGDPAPGSAGESRMDFMLIDDSGKITRLLLDPELARSQGGILSFNRKRVVVVGRVVNESAVEATAIFPEDAAGVEGAEAATSSRPWISILCKFPDVPGYPNPLSYFVDMYSSAYPGMDHYWREVSFDLINVTGSGAVGWYTLPQPKSYYVYDRDGDGDPDLDHGRAAIDCTAAAEPDVFFLDFSGINMMFNDELDGYAWGGGWYLNLDGEERLYSATWEPPWGYQNVTVIAHEMGHGFGMPHSSGMYGQIYDNAWDVMSDAWRNCDIAQYPPYGCLGQHTIALHKDMLGWIPQALNYTAHSFNQTVTLEQLALPQTGSYRQVRIPIDGSPTNFYTLEARRLVGYDFKLPGAAVIIHEVDTSRPIPAHVVDIDGNGNTGDAGAMWTVGESFIDALHHITVSVDAATATGYVITVQQLPVPAHLSPPQNQVLLPGQVTFSWTPIPDASGYDIQIDSVPTFNSPDLITASVVSPSYSHSFTALGARYWRVRALPGAPWTAAWQFRITNNVINVSSSSEEDYYPALATTASGQLVSVWARNGRLWLARSTDQGGAWSPASQLTQQCCYSQPTLHRKSNNHLWLAFNYNDDIWYQTSSNDGATWSSARQVTNGSDYDGEPDIAEMANGELWIVWGSNRGGHGGIWYTKSTNGGATWSTALEIPSSPEWQGHPTITQAPNGDILVFWFRSYGLAYSTTSNGGVAWSPQALLDVGGPILSPHLRRGNDGTLWLAYSLVYWDAGTWRSNLNYKTSTDNGVAWSEPQQLTRFVGDNLEPALASLSSDSMAFAWRSNRTGNTDIWFAIPGQREDVNPPPYVAQIEHLPASFPDSNDLVSFRAWASDETGLALVKLAWHINGSQQPELAMYDDGLHGDDAAGDGIYGVQHQPLAAGDTVEYRTRAVDSDGNTFLSYARSFSVHHWADFDDNGNVDVADLTLVATCWLQAVGGACSSEYDPDLDGDIDMVDIMRVAASWSP